MKKRPEKTGLVIKGTEHQSQKRDKESEVNNFELSLRVSENPLDPPIGS